VVGLDFQAAIEQFALNYTTEDREDFAFAWTGEEDDNEEIRGFISDWILDHPEQASIELIRDVLIENANWAQQSWTAPIHSKELIALYERRGGSDPRDVISGLKALLEQKS
jgi:hypothetical protein